ncbi:hypothetical protein [Lentzea sp. NPDC055074]
MATRTVDDEFLALVCADADLLSAEFDAIIEANWGEPLPSPSPRRSVPPARHSTVPRPHATDYFPGGVLARQRSPPHRKAGDV